ncbi:hypothetical protein DAPPUDRAFT_248394 [Daphnia pulex]|uniref:Uncharacterized protein n=1 Tax=Daphnia pulex TaxID=6669 RepID=E9GUK3_DAPPU|nr:hypothetical protein DAPPUDRAFT_248394 [Daphnia pulex]|eukprot:EFX76739.1 hypothetical protein DAPPUDRAFT_248394 [Daphnia pulex]
MAGGSFNDSAVRQDLKSSSGSIVMDLKEEANLLNMESFLMVSKETQSKYSPTTHTLANLYKTIVISKVDYGVMS